MKGITVSTIVAFTLVLFFSGAAVAMSSVDEQSDIFYPQIMETSGPVKVKGVKYEIWEPAEEGMLLLAGDMIKTGKGGYASIEFPSGTVEMYETTVMVIPSIVVKDRNKDIREIAVEEGNVLFDINPLGVERGFEFRTRNVQGGVKGTVFTVSYIDEGTTVNVYRGVVQVSDLLGTKETLVDLKAGESLRVEDQADFNNITRFDAKTAIADYNYNVPPGLDGKGLPADYNANPDNNGVRDRGQGIGKDKNNVKD